MSDDRRIYQVQARKNGVAMWFEQGEKVGRRINAVPAAERAREWGRANGCDEIFITFDPDEFMQVER